MDEFSESSEVKETPGPEGGDADEVENDPDDLDLEDDSEDSESDEKEDGDSDGKSDETGDAGDKSDGTSAKNSDGQETGEGTAFKDKDINDLDAEYNLTDDTKDTIDKAYKEKIDGKMFYYDDHGKNYRINDDLVPNNTYELNKYKFTTDDLGRIESAEGYLQVKDHDKRNPIKDSMEKVGKGYQAEGDDRGHLIADRFNGPNGLENLVPQNADINRKDFRNFEGDLAQKVKDGKEVYVIVMPNYEDDSRRPTDIDIAYTVNGKEDYRTFPNERKGKKDDE